MSQVDFVSSVRPWHKFYGKNVRAVLPEPTFKTIADLARYGAAAYGDHVAFTTVLPNGMDASLTFQQIDALSDVFAAYLRGTLKLKEGDRVALQIPNGLAFPIAAFGVFKAGCVLVNTNPLYTADEMIAQFKSAKPAALIIVNLFADKVPEVLKQCPIPHVIITEAASLFPFLKRTLVSVAQRYVQKTVPAANFSYADFAATLKAGQAYLAQHPDVVAGYTAALTSGALACLQYTGGTTGISKGAMLTHANIIYNMMQIIEMVGEDIVKGKEVLLTALPMYHIFAFTVNFLGFYWLGAHNVMVPNPRPIKNVQPVFAKYPISWVTGVNTLFNALLNEPWFADNPPKSLKASVAGGMALQAAVAQKWFETTKTPVIEGYGLTESSPVLSFNPFGAVKAGTIGIPVPMTDMRCLDDTGHPVAVGEAGEIAARGPQVMLGYWEQPAESAKTFTPDGWLLTGDIGIMDSDSYFSIVDRKKDMILVSGFNVYPNEVEACLAHHPSVLEAAVVGIPDGAAGEAVKAVIVLKTPATAEEIRTYCKEHLTGYKVPRVVEFVSELPKTAVGKILRRALRG
jgi:long-chain acyl-CoA synthetase